MTNPNPAASLAGMFAPQGGQPIASDSTSPAGATTTLLEQVSVIQSQIQALTQAAGPEFAPFAEQAIQSLVNGVVQITASATQPTEVEGEGPAYA